MNIRDLLEGETSKIETGKSYKIDLSHGDPNNKAFYINVVSAASQGAVGEDANLWSTTDLSVTVLEIKDDQVLLGFKPPVEGEYFGMTGPRKCKVKSGWVDLDAIKVKA